MARRGGSGYAVPATPRPRMSAMFGRHCVMITITRIIIIKTITLMMLTLSIIIIRLITITIICPRSALLSWYCAHCRRDHNCHCHLYSLARLACAS